jgi:hypothetical protein
MIEPIAGFVLSKIKKPVRASRQAAAAAMRDQQLAEIVVRG